MQKIYLNARSEYNCDSTTVDVISIIRDYIYCVCHEDNRADNL